jgi:hypothetical protein
VAPRRLLHAIANLGWVSLGDTAGKMVAATNQAAEERYRTLRNDQISARNSSLVVGTGLKIEKKASRNLLSRLALQCRDNKTAIELFVAGVRGWEADFRRQIDA